MRFVRLILLSAVVLAFTVPISGDAAQTLSGTGCLVKDAASVQHWDPTCEWHLVIKRDSDGAIQFVHYQDHGQLPEGAAHPDSATFTTHQVNCGGCALEGVYQELTTPSGEYHSSGPN